MVVCLGLTSHAKTPLHGVLAIPELNGRFLYNYCSDPESDCGRLLGSTPAARRYKGHLSGIKGQEIADPCESCLYRYPSDP